MFRSCSSRRFNSILTPNRWRSTVFLAVPTAYTRLLPCTFCRVILPTLKSSIVFAGAAGLSGAGDFSSAGVLVALSAGVAGATAGVTGATGGLGVGAAAVGATAVVVCF